VELASRCEASLDALHYHFPEEDLPPGRTADEHLRLITEAGLRTRYPGGASWTRFRAAGCFHWRRRESNPRRAVRNSRQNRALTS